MNIPGRLLNISSLALVLSLIIFVALCFQQPIVQDDAYISFRYADNYLAGHGLVYNIGERVEGYTNFLWIIVLILLKSVVDLDYVVIARILGVAGGLSIILILYLFARRHFRNHSTLIFLSAAILLFLNRSIPYWSMSGLETSVFVALSMTALFLESRKSHLTAAILAIASLLRPEGFIIFLIIVIHRIAVEKRFPFFLSIVYFLLFAPFMIFRFFYYGSLLPNTYYAKSGIGIEYITSGVEYFTHFLTTAGAYGVIVALPILTCKSLWKRYSLLYAYIFLYICYVIGVGGDTLKVYRFFVPVLPVMHFLFVASIIETLSSPSLNRFFPKKIFIPAVLSLSILTGFSSYLLSRNHIETYRTLEKGLIDKMGFISTMLAKNMNYNFTLAASTIGILGYQLSEHHVIDMLGLTDSSIARNPENIKGLTSTWKERRFDSRYLLEQQPDFIVFSTNDKPSAPAELALFQHSEFRKNYSPTGFLRDYQKDWWAFVYKRWGKINMAIDTIYPEISFANELKKGYDFRSEGKYADAVYAFEKAGRLLGEEYDLLLSNIGECLYRQKLIDSSLWYFQRAIELNPYNWRSRHHLERIAMARGDTSLAHSQAKAIFAMSPWVYDNSYGAAAVDDKMTLSDPNAMDIIKAPMKSQGTVAHGSESSPYSIRDSTETLNKIATQFLEHGDATSAIYYLKLSLSIDSTNLWTYHKLAEAYRHSGMTAELRMLAFRMTNIFCNNARGQMDAGQLFCQLGDMEKGGACLKRAYEIDSSDVFIMVNYGVYHLQRGDLQKSFAPLKKAVEQYPDYFAANYNLSLVYLSVGDRTKALIYLKHAGQLAANASDSTQVANILHRLR